MSLNIRPYQERAVSISKEINSIKSEKNETAKITKIYEDTFKLCKDVDKVLVTLDDTEFSRVLPDINKLFELFEVVETLAKKNNIVIPEIRDHQNAEKGVYYRNLNGGVSQKPREAEAETRPGVAVGEKTPALGAIQTFDEYKQALAKLPVKEYTEQSFVDKINRVQSSGFSGVISVGKDNNCFYRSVYVPHLFNVLRSPPKIEQLAKIIEDVKEGDQEFQAAKIKVLQHLRSAPQFNTPQQINRWINENSDMDRSYIRVFKQLASDYVRKNPDYEIGGISIRSWISGSGTTFDAVCKEIEKMDHEAEGVALSALPLALGIRLNIFTLFTGDKNQSLQQVRGSPYVEPSIDILFRPGHYDILLK